MAWFLGLIRRIPWQAYAIAAALLVAFLWHRAEMKEAYRDGQANVWGQVEKAQAAQREAEREATVRLELSRRLEAEIAAARQKELNDATANLPGQKPSDRQRIRACLQLRAEDKAASRPIRSC